MSFISDRRGGPETAWLLEPASADGPEGPDGSAPASGPARRSRPVRSGAKPRSPGAVKRQLPLDLPVRPALARADFLVAEANETAVGLIDEGAGAWPARAAAIHGPAGCGKSHLAAVWREASGAVSLAPEEVTPARAGDLGATGPLVLDFADAVPGRGEQVRGDEFESGLFHLLNRVRQKETGLLIVAREAPARWPVLLPDLRSRLAALPAAAIAAPDDALLAAVLTKLFRDRQIGTGADQISYLLPRMERSLEAANRLAALMDRLSLAAQTPVTRRTAAEALALLEAERA